MSESGESWWTERFSMLLDQRRGSIREFIETKGFVSLHEIAESVGVSESTVRRDLEYLDRTGQIRRTRGGAAGVGEALPAFDDRENQFLNEKQRVGRKVAELIQPGETILLDGGTTTLHVAKHLGPEPFVSVLGIRVVALGHPPFRENRQTGHREEAGQEQSLHRSIPDRVRPDRGAADGPRPLVRPLIFAPGPARRKNGPINPLEKPAPTPSPTCRTGKRGDRIRGGFPQPGRTGMNQPGMSGVGRPYDDWKL